MFFSNSRVAFSLLLVQCALGITHKLVDQKYNRDWGYNLRKLEESKTKDIEEEVHFAEFGLHSKQQTEHFRQARSAKPKEDSKRQKKFKDYEFCMEKNDKLKRKFYTNYIKIEALVVGDNVKLNSLICPRPDQDIESYNVRWLRQLPSSEKPTQVLIDDEKFVLTDDKSLIIEEANLDDGGEYICYMGKAHTAAYMVDVLPDEDYQNVVNPPEKGNQPALPLALLDNNLKLVTDWTEWSKCSQCDKRGTHRKLGYCMVRKLKPNDKTIPYTPWLEHLKDGLPCRSSLLPESIRTIKDVRRRKSENMIGYCFEACPTQPPTMVYTDAAGMVIETVNTGEGFVSMKEGRPKIPSLVKRKVVYEKVGRQLRIKCPHEDNRNIAIRWQNGSQTLNALLIKRETRGRVVITGTQALTIRQLRFSDTAIYSCWIQGQHIATVKVRVIEKMRRDYKDYILLAGFGAVFLILLSIGCGVVSAQQKRSLR